VDGFYRKPRMDNELLAEHAGNLVALSGCMGGAIPQMIHAGDVEKAEAAALRYREIFGPDQFYLELMRNGVEGQEEVNRALMEMSRRHKIPLVATNDVHYLEQNDALVHEVMLCINTGQTLKDEKRMKMESDEFYFRSAEEMWTLFADVPEALENTVRIASMCDLAFTFNEYHLPEFHLDTGETPFEYLKKLCDEGARQRFDEVTGEIEERLENELDVIRSMGFPSYFLITWDFIRFAKENDIPVGPGRGSAAGSLVAYCLGITDVNPLKYDLIFERFLNSSRISMPDIDIDFCRDGREKVIQYVQEKYGASNVCQIVTFGTMAARAAIRDAGRVLDIDLPTVDRIAKKIPMIPKTRIREALDSDMELKEIYESEPRITELFDISMKIEGLNRHASTHAAGVVITDKPLTEYVPLCRVQNEINTQYQMEALEKIGLLKMDFLGLKNLTIMDKAVRLIRRSRGEDLDLAKIDLGDAKAFRLLQSGKTLGIFQLESEGMSNLLVRLKPDTFEDIIALLALYRPGPLKSGMVDSYVKRKHGHEEVDYLDDCLKEVLKDTYGVIVYQEQVMRIANILAGFSLNDADSLRKAMGKKKTEVMAKFRDMFIDGAERLGHDRAKAADIYDKIEFFAGYGFNKSHSTAYGVITYQTAYLKANYPLEFMAALMSCDAGNSDKIAEYRDECKRMGIEVLGPDFNESDHDFTIGDGTIRFGLSAIKGVGDKAIETIIESRRRKGGFATLQEMLIEVDLKAVNKIVLEALVKSGAFDSLGHNRSTLMRAVEGLLRWAAGVQVDRKVGQKGLFGKAATTGEMMELPVAEEWDENERLSHEKEVLGFYISSDPIKKYGHWMPYLAPVDLGEVKRLDDGVRTTMGGIVTNLRLQVLKNGRNAGKQMALFKLRTREGNLSCVAFPKEYEKLKQYLVDDAFRIFSGQIDMSRGRTNPSLKVTTVDTVDSAIRDRSTLIIRLGSSDGIQEQQLEEVISASEQYPGSSDLLLHFDNPGHRSYTVKAGTKHRVELCETLLAGMEEIVGRGNVEIR
jgi:DNA polymerase-3 subunit alpha